jgi:hypothetical protein
VMGCMSLLGLHIQPNGLSVYYSGPVAYWSSKGFKPCGEIGRVRNYCRDILYRDLTAIVHSFIFAQPLMLPTKPRTLPPLALFLQDRDYV